MREAAEGVNDLVTIRLRCEVPAVGGHLHQQLDAVPVPYLHGPEGDDAKPDLPVPRRPFEKVCALLPPARRVISHKAIVKRFSVIR